MVAGGRSAGVREGRGLRADGCGPPSCPSAPREAHGGHRVHRPLHRTGVIGFLDRWARQAGRKVHIVANRVELHLTPGRSPDELLNSDEQRVPTSNATRLLRDPTRPLCRHVGNRTLSTQWVGHDFVAAARPLGGRPRVVVGPGLDRTVVAPGRRSGQGATGPGRWCREEPSHSTVSRSGATGGAGTKLVASSTLPEPSYRARSG